MKRNVILSALRVAMLGVLALPIVSCEEDDVKVIECIDANHIHAVDLGLSVKWACCNVDASSPEEFGCYYAWGETYEKKDYTTDTYRFVEDVDGNGFCSEGEWINIGTNICNTSYDVAHMKLGDGWRMPTVSEVRELGDKCSWEWTHVNGVGGQKVTGPNGNSIFIPAAGYRVNAIIDGRASAGIYWTGTNEQSEFSYVFSFDNKGYHKLQYLNREYGLSVRPVKD